MSKVRFDSNLNKYIFVARNGKKREITAQSTSKTHLYNSVIKCANIIRKVKHHDEEMSIHGFLFIKDEYKLIKERPLFFKVNGKDYPLLFSMHIAFGSNHFMTYRLDIPYRDLAHSPINNRLSITFTDKKGYGFYKRIKYNFLQGDKTHYNSSLKKIIAKTNSAIYLHQSLNNSVYLVNRVANMTDLASEQKKLKWAHLLACLCPFRKVTLMYEKESSKYEESASVLFEHLIDLGYQNIYYVITKESATYLKIKPSYLKNILYKGTFKHYLLFFQAKTFIGTEVPAHALDLRISNKYAEKKLQAKKYRFVFLQHGVMYMVSLGSKTRKAFRRGNLMPDNTKIVVSSETEAKHFIDYGNYLSSDIYVTGLPKFDVSKRNDTAKKIVIMPTWRPWEYNEIRHDFAKTGYYKMLHDMLSSVPLSLKENVIILPHPLFLEYSSTSDLSTYISTDISYDEILKETDILITDYSSIAYDAFYRGANVIFWWKEKEECMDKYGGFLMLDKTNTFGDICIKKSELKAAIINNYQKPQTKEYIKRYRRLVQFDDNKNTERLIAELAKDHLIKKRG